MSSESGHRRQRRWVTETWSFLQLTEVLVPAALSSAEDTGHSGWSSCWTAVLGDRRRFSLFLPRAVVLTKLFHVLFPEQQEHLQSVTQQLCHSVTASLSSSSCFSLSHQSRGLWLQFRLTNFWTWDATHRVWKRTADCTNQSQVAAPSQLNQFVLHYWPPPLLSELTLSHFSSSSF